MPLYALDGVAPKVADKDRLWVAPDAHVIGDVTLGLDVGIWFGSVLRGDNDPLVIGARTNIQEGTMMHTDLGYPLTLGEDCTIGHHAILHGCTIGNRSLVGMGATVLNGAVIGENCLIGANALVTEGKQIPDGSLVIGAPAKVVRPLSDNEIAGLKSSAENYVANARRFSGGPRADRRLKRTHSFHLCQRCFVSDGFGTRVHVSVFSCFRLPDQIRDAP
jgi:carbonic anhydrase/acetyltransferase-like protein (isoleucine patch superfamily)